MLVGAIALIGSACVLGSRGGSLAKSKDAEMKKLFSLEPCDKGVGESPCAPPSTMPEKRTDDMCSWRGQNCHHSECCRDSGMQCYKQGPGWSECKATCTTGPDPTHFDSGNWSCAKLGPRTPGAAPKCGGPGEDCTHSYCCTEPGTQCYEKKVGSWAVCKVACTEGIDLTDSNSEPWTCAVLGPRAPVAATWVALECAQDGADCRDTKCCAQPGSQCYKRDDDWAQCKPMCTPGVDPAEPWTDKTWNCDTLGSRTPTAAPAHERADFVADWVKDVCAAGTDNCVKSECCSESGHQCFLKTEGVGKCKSECLSGPDLFDVDGKPWSCEAVGPRTPGQAKVVPAGNVSAWVARTCATNDGGCSESQCCQTPGMQCYEKGPGWAACLLDCRPGENRSEYGDLDAATWSCKELGPRTPRPWATPSLFCFSVIRVEGYEADLMRDQMAQGAGIFACDEFAVFSAASYVGAATTYWHPASDDNIVQPMVTLNLGLGPVGRVDTIAFEPTYVGTSMDHTAGNTKLFLRVWQQVLATGKHINTDWTLKVDPDAVLFPSRLRSQLLPHNGQNTYIVNCNKPGMNPMMFGSVEIFSKLAMQNFFVRQQECLDGLSWKAWGEDYFMGQCLDKLGVGRTDMFDLVSDGVCKGVDCGNPNAAAFHPKKDSASWMACLRQAEASR